MCFVSRIPSIQLLQPCLNSRIIIILTSLPSLPLIFSPTFSYTNVVNHAIIFKSCIYLVGCYLRYFEKFCDKYFDIFNQSLGFLEVEFTICNEVLFDNELQDGDEIIKQQIHLSINDRIYVMFCLKHEIITVVSGSIYEIER